jgi:hypothetical protein
LRTGSSSSRCINSRDRILAVRSRESPLSRRSREASRDRARLQESATRATLSRSDRYVQWRRDVSSCFLLRSCHDYAPGRCSSRRATCTHVATRSYRRIVGDDRKAARPLRRYLRARVRATLLYRSYTITGDTTWSERPTSPCHCQNGRASDQP